MPRPLSYDLGRCLVVLSVFLAFNIKANNLESRIAARQKLQEQTPPSKDRVANSPLNHPQWKNYVHSLLAYQKLFPGIYTPIDLIRWDKIPEDWLFSQIRKHGLLWERLKSKTLSMNDRRTEQTVLSRNANEELYRKILELEKSQKGFFWMGSTRFVLDSLDESERVSLTPLDPVFQKSDLGSQIYSRIKLKENAATLSGFLIDKKSQRMIFESADSGYYKVEFHEAPTPQELLIRTYFGKNERLGSDIKIRKENFRGYLFNTSSNEPLPMGPLPLKKNQWVDESGRTHYSGDGHQGCKH